MVVVEREQVISEGSENSFGKSIVFVEEGSEVVEDRSCARHLHQLKHPHRCSYYRNRHLAYQGFDDFGLAQQGVFPAKLEHNAFEPSIGFVEGLL